MFFSGLLLSNSILMLEALRYFMYLYNFFLIGFSTQMSAQESIITGLENIHFQKELQLTEKI